MKPKFKHWQCRALLIVGSLGILGNLMGQPYIFKGDSLPPHPKENSWFHYSVTQQVWAYSKGKWALMSQIPVESLYACGAMPMLKFYNYTYTVNLDRSVWEVVDDHWCGEHLTVIRQDFLLKYYDPNMKLVAESDTVGGPTPFQPMKVQGMDAFCARLDPIKKTVIGDGFYQEWGILGTNGKWLINPIFDQPFRFVNGVADVVYLGQNRKINMQGVFVDALRQSSQ